MYRLIAFLVLLIPGILAVYGIKLMRDSFFGFVNPVFFNVIIQLFAGLIFVIIGIGFIGGFLLHRDRKKNKTKGRFKNEK
ncbi:DUF2627 family protein [Filobacillus milosensis]|uniref:DUF2627 family protein n=1 Tax=Filobacillus milosensis TaxID=94137 RepID=A0A4Y8IQM2_9BACI|nr:DUF2627 family protein [Filobacillus milosensis]TFB23856.1 DUF2627 family protein [Filobacillus milosensis]